MPKRTSDFDLVTTLSDTDTLTGVQGGVLDINITAASLKAKMGIIQDAGGYFPDDTVEAALQYLGAFVASAGTTYQPLDSDLSDIAALPTTPYGRSLLTTADAVALRTSINAQPLDADLTAIAALVTTGFGRSLLTVNDAAGLAAAAGAQPLDSDLTAIAALPTTAYGRGFLTQADAPAARTYIGASSSADPVFTGVVTVPDATTPTGAVTLQQMQAADALKTDKATLTVDGDLYTRAGGVVTRITRSGLANDPAFVTKYARIGEVGPQGPTGPQGPAGVGGPFSFVQELKPTPTLQGQTWWNTTNGSTWAAIDRGNGVLVWVQF